MTHAAVEDLDLLTIDEVAALLRCSRSHVKNLIRREAIASIKTGKRRVITRSAVAEYVAALHS